MSTNPWKITATFQAVASTRDEFMTVLQKMKDAAPSEPKFGEKRSKLELAHLALVKALEHRVELIDHELAVSMSLFLCCSRCHALSHGGKGSRSRSLDDGTAVRVTDGCALTENPTGAAEDSTAEPLNRIGRTQGDTYAPKNNPTGLRLHE